MGLAYISGQGGFRRALWTAEPAGRQPKAPDRRVHLMRVPRMCLNLPNPADQLLGCQTAGQAEPEHGIPSSVIRVSGTWQM
jgi:hypothetical protein